MSSGHSNLIQRRPAAVVVATAVGGLCATALVVALEQLWFAYPRPGLQIALQTSSALVALLAAFLVFGRLRRGLRLADVALAYALGVFAAAKLFFAGVLAADPGAYVERNAAWMALAGALVATAMFAAASLLPGRRARGGRLVPLLAVLTVALVAVAVIAVSLLASRLPIGVLPRAAPTTAHLADLNSTWPIAAIESAALVLFVVAAVGFTLRARSTRDELLGWLAVAAVFGALGAVNSLLYPSLYSRWVFTRDLFRLGFYVVILLGAVQEIRSYWRTVRAVAVLEERRRIARELHDGLAQELAFITRRAKRVARRGDPDGAQLAAAAGRALDESRRALAALIRPLDEPFERTLTEAVETVAARVGARVRVDVTPGIVVDASVRNELARIACEAVVNATDHGHADDIHVELVAGAPSVLRITDDGLGFDESLPGGGRGRFGIAGMRERALAIGGELRLRSEPGSGTTVEVAFR